MQVKINLVIITYKSRALLLSTMYKYYKTSDSSFVISLSWFFKLDSPLSLASSMTTPSSPPATTHQLSDDTDPQSSGSGENQQIRRRRTTSKTAGANLQRRPSLLDRRNSLTRDIEHAAAETYLITHLAFKLLSYLGYCFNYLSIFYFMQNK